MAGRPKTLDKKHALATALEGYWRQGVYGMSVNEVCRRADISKPGLYREFGGEDGLLTAVLQLYRETVVVRFQDHLEKGHPFLECMQLFIGKFFRETGHPPGCLLAEYRLAYQDLGESTQELVRDTVTAYRAILRAWLGRCLERGEIAQSTDLDFAAQYVDLQLYQAAVITIRGGDPEVIAANLLTAIQVLVSPTERTTRP